MIEFHAITPQGRQLIAQLVDGKLVIPPFSDAIPPKLQQAPVITTSVISPESAQA